MMLAQREMRHKPHETVHFTAALGLIADITGAIVTADTLHTVADHARYLHRRGAFGLFPVKENRAALFARLDALNWDETTNPQISMVRTEEPTAAATRPASSESRHWKSARSTSRTPPRLCWWSGTPPAGATERSTPTPNSASPPHPSRPPTQPPSPAA
ncbi:hypothetical protein [Salinispora arenicola]|uniref:hypothetical protein n=1 Tax=Salinispora arenicola TaxID=168697 RepID=UPI00207AB2FE|nr:hypothetical protein [Salinispora arenicola]MCN0154359.1 hypothetical protein [Salinispora arenicola]